MRQAPRTFQALTSELWAIEPGWLPMLAAIAQRQSHSETEVAREWVKRDHALMAGPAAQKLAGAFRGFVVDGIGVLPITGPIFPRANMMTEMSGATSVTMLQNDFKVMLDNRDVRGVQLLVDSPGGAVTGIASFAQTVAAGTRRKPVTAYVLGSACSAAYWIASATQKISVDRTAVLGSIGVVAVIPKQVGPGQDGMVEVEIVSSNAPNKRPDPQSDDGSSEIRRSLDVLERVFIGDVSRGRGVPTSKVINDFGKGGILIGVDAVNAGMADAVETQQAAMSLMKLNILSPNNRRASDGNYQRLAALRQGGLQGSNQARLNRLNIAGLRR